MVVVEEDVKLSECKGRPLVSVWKKKRKKGGAEQRAEGGGERERKSIKKRKEGKKNT